MTTMIIRKTNAFVALLAVLLLGGIPSAKAQDTFKEFLAQNKAQEEASHKVEVAGSVILVSASLIGWLFRRARK